MLLFLLRVDSDCSSLTDSVMSNTNIIHWWNKRTDIDAGSVGINTNLFQFGVQHSLSLNHIPHLFSLGSSHLDQGIIPRAGFGASFNIAKYSIWWPSWSRKKTEADGIQHNAFGSSVS